ncbi:hypothetical protein Hanom_Chr09g00789911 [Helianthus anomalus]
MHSSITSHMMSSSFCLNDFNVGSTTSLQFLLSFRYCAACTYKRIIIMTL